MLCHIRTEQKMMIHLVVKLPKLLAPLFMSHGWI